MNNNRISSGMAYGQSVALMMAKQSKLATLQQQLATGQSFATAKANPVAAGTGVLLDRALNELDRLGENASTVQNRLGLQENALAQAGDYAQRINELTVQANNTAVMSADDKRAVSAELRAIKQSLLDIANSSDGQGRYLFAGSADDAPPFSMVNGKVTYAGDQTQRTVEVAPGLFVRDTLPGSDTFLRIRTGDGTVDGAASDANTGSGVLTDVTRDGSAPWTGGTYTVRFTSASEYEVLDSAGDAVTTGPYRQGEPILVAGLHITIQGNPATGDEFAMGSASTRDVFSTMDRLISALEMDTTNDSDLVAQKNILQSSMRDIARVAENLIDARSAGGAQLQALDSADELRQSNFVTLKTSLSQIRDLDYAEAIGQYQLETTALQAAQTIFSQMQSMSLFNTLR